MKNTGNTHPSTTPYRIATCSVSSLTMPQSLSVRAPGAVESHEQKAQEKGGFIPLNLRWWMLKEPIRHPSLSLSLRCSVKMVSLGSTSRVSVFPVIVLTKICMGTRQEGGEAEAEERRAGCARVWGVGSVRVYKVLIGYSSTGRKNSCQHSSQFILPRIPF